MTMSMIFPTTSKRRRPHLTSAMKRKDSVRENSVGRVATRWTKILQTSMLRISPSPISMRLKTSTLSRGRSRSWSTLALATLPRIDPAAGPRRTFPREISRTCGAELFGGMTRSLPGLKLISTNSSKWVQRKMPMPQRKGMHGAKILHAGRPAEFVLICLRCRQSRRRRRPSARAPKRLGKGRGRAQVGQGMEMHSPESVGISMREGTPFSRSVRGWRPM
mmetsp:Transcript_2645/g.7762  ORF Transcript_2645/g.7762 Transcript_2645/m.7762 type:complete len:220 (-) Transcript_2645:2905-3564(-)